MSKLYRASSDFIGDASLSVEQRSTLKVKSICLPILADDPWEPGAQEGDVIDDIVLEELGINVKPRGGDDKKKFDNMVVQYEVALSFLRELLIIPFCELFITLARDKHKANIRRYKGLSLRKIP